jgi:hypothetical protein
MDPSGVVSEVQRRPPLRRPVQKLLKSATSTSSTACGVGRVPVGHGKHCYRNTAGSARSARGRASGRPFSIAFPGYPAGCFFGINMACYRTPRMSRPAVLPEAMQPPSLLLGLTLFPIEHNGVCIVCPSGRGWDVDGAGGADRMDKSGMERNAVQVKDLATSLDFRYFSDFRSIPYHAWIRVRTDRKRQVSVISLKRCVC